MQEEKKVLQLVYALCFTVFWGFAFCDWQWFWFLNKMRISYVTNNLKAEMKIMKMKVLVTS